MKKIAIAIAALALAGGAFAQEKPFGYHRDTAGMIVHDNYGQCVRTGYWTPELAIAECDPSLVKVAAPAPAPVVAPKPAPVVAPAPVQPVARAVAPVPVVVPAPVVVPVPAPAPAPVKVAKKLAIEAETAFAVGKSELTGAGKTTVDKEVLEKLTAFSTIENVTVEGHADPMGKESANVTLSKNRAEAVKAYLVSKGVKADLITTEGKGSSQPKAGVNCDAKLPKAKLSACYAPHRRIEIDVKGIAK